MTRIRALDRLKADLIVLKYILNFRASFGVKSKCSRGQIVFQSRLDLRLAFS